MTTETMTAPALPGRDAPPDGVGAPPCRLGFRIIGPTHGERRLVEWPRAFAAYCAADPRAGVEREGYLSAFTFEAEFREHLARTGSTRGYSGPCGSDWLWLDLDRDDAAGGIEAALADARALCLQAGERFGIDDDRLLCFYSGRRGFHVGVPLDGFNPAPGPAFHRIARKVAEGLAAAAGVTIDTGVYDAVRAFRAPNSKHPKTGLHKRRFTVRELLHLPASRIIAMAAEPEGFDVPAGGGCALDMPAAWAEAAETVRAEDAAAAERRAAIGSGAAASTLNRLTLDFIRDGAGVGDRHRRLFSAAADLAECGAPLELCRALLAEAALDSGLPPGEVERQIRCGVEHAAKGGAV